MVKVFALQNSRISFNSVQNNKVISMYKSHARITYSNIMRNSNQLYNSIVGNNMYCVFTIMLITVKLSIVKLHNKQLRKYTILYIIYIVG